MLSFDHIKSAHERIRHLVRWTPLLSSPLLSQELGREVFVKAECLQITGSFKLRGASNKIEKLSAEQLQCGVVAFSSGNHAQGVAAAAYRKGISADIVMPADTPKIKVALTKNWGGTVHFYDRVNEDRQAIATKIATEKGAALIPPFDDIDVIEGQGTAGYEMMEDCQSLGIKPAAVIVPCSGGGISAGVATAVKHHHADCHVYVGEPVGFDSTGQSVRAGKITTTKTPIGNANLCDALLAPTPGHENFAINGKLLQGGFAMSDAEVSQAMLVAFNHFKLVVEGGGAIALAALLKHHAALPKGAVVVVLSGGNIDPALYQQILSKSL